jgi:hypothetical protein
MPKARRPLRVVLTPRDGEILWSVHQARYLSVECIEWLHFPQWRDRYARWQQAQADGNAQRYKACTQAYTRMQQLEAAGYVGRVVRPTTLAITTYQREADLFFLTRQGAEALAAWREMPVETLHYGEPRLRSFLLLMHHEAVGRVYAALRGKLALRADLQFTDWRSEHDFQREHDTIPVATPQPDGRLVTEEQGIQPDGGFFLHHPGGRTLVFLEVERDQPLAKWRTKVWAYEAYAGSAALRERCGGAPVLYLGVGTYGISCQIVLAALPCCAWGWGSPPTTRSGWIRKRMSSFASYADVGKFTLPKWGEPTPPLTIPTPECAQWPRGGISSATSGWRIRCASGRGGGRLRRSWTPTGSGRCHSACA